MGAKFYPILLIFILLFDFNLPLAAYGAGNVANNQQAIATSNKYAKLGHEAYNQGRLLQAAQYYEKAYKAYKYPVYLDNTVTAYVSYAYDLANKKDYDAAIPYCNKALALKPNFTSAKEALSEIYYAKGVDLFYVGQLEKAKLELEKSLKFAVNADQVNRAKEDIAKVEQSIKNGEVTVPQYEETSDVSVPDVVLALENKIYGAPNTNLPLLNRITRLEKDTLGTVYDTDSLIVRADRLKRAILPELVSQGSSATQANPNNYIYDINQQSMGRVTIFGKMPVTVFIDECQVKPYKKFYKDAVIEGFKEWEKATNNKIKFSFIQNPAQADIQVVWQELFEDFPWQPELRKEDLSGVKQRNKYRKASAAVQVGSLAAMLAGGLGIPVIGTMGMLGGSFASPYLQYKGTEITKLSPDVKINTKVTENMTDDQAKLKIKQIAMHQAGHALGLFGHSSNPNDIMYSNFSAYQLSQRDINTITEIYNKLDAEKEKADNKPAKNEGKKQEKK